MQDTDDDAKDVETCIATKILSAESQLGFAQHKFTRCHTEHITTKFKHNVFKNLLPAPDSVMSNTNTNKDPKKKK